MVATALSLLAFWSLLAAIIIGLSLGVGGLLHWLAPAIDPGLGAIVAALGIIAAAQLLARIMKAAREQQLQDAEESPDIDYEDVEWIGRIGTHKTRKRRYPWGQKPADSSRKKAD